MTTFSHETRSRTQRYAGPIFSVFTDEVTMPGGRAAARDVTENPGAVGVVALDDADRVVLIKQYRHPVRRKLWELPAGLRDVAGEDLALTALRELAEEADLVAGRLDLLVDLHTSPGFSNETIRLFLARDLSPVPEDGRHVRTDEEADLEIVRVDLDEAVAMILRGEITNASAVGGVLAASAARAAGWTTLRPADTPAI
ncbi:ADP-ribose pyrophosphatase [Krasilnikovia cinnamomea]|uniref:ADP-ribose pyrophosphatase n=1 Tax=Krasilnikovia cinnamomea TaxID=349313 RepID=A0A4Q7ZDZ6_9ACTN|nr:NUDIX hydrolase [Krasilnikovia cinnamomea]RZU48878.1 ADP-ribose pyrophosphatase [Krasilnikovia cinnamomea]